MKISPRQYAQTLYDLTDGKAKPEVERLLTEFSAHLKKERKLALADRIIEQFGRIYNQQKGIVEAEIVSRKKMDETLAKKVKHFVKEKYSPRSGGAGGAKEVIVKNIIDENIKGGIVIKIGDEVVDGSVRGKLKELRKVLA